jgi:hypothetical protein
MQKDWQKMSSEDLKRFALEILQYAEQMYLERSVAVAALERTGDVAAMVVYRSAVQAGRDTVHQQFLPLYEQLEAAIADQEIQDAIGTILQKLPKGPVN